MGRGNDNMLSSRLIISGTRPSEKWKEGLGNRLGRKCTIWNNYLPVNACLEDFYIPRSGSTLISGKRLTV